MGVTKDGQRCPLCKGEGWIEILGAGMVDPNVFEHVRDNGYDPEKVNGFAFGIGVERIAVLKHASPTYGCSTTSTCGSWISSDEALYRGYHRGARQSVPQRVTFIILRRPSRVTFTVGAHPSPAGHAPDSPFGSLDVHRTGFCPPTLVHRVLYVRPA